MRGCVKASCLLARRDTQKVTSIMARPLELSKNKVESEYNKNKKHKSKSGYGEL